MNQQQLTLSLPIYWTDVKKRVPSKTYLVGMNWYNNSNYHLKNKVKRDYHELVNNLTLQFPKLDKFKVEYTLFYKNPTSDGANIIAVIEKFFLDGLVSANIITNDNVAYHKGSTWSIGEQSKLDPRVEITLTGI